MRAVPGGMGACVAPGCLPAPAWGPLQAASALLWQFAHECAAFLGDGALHTMAGGHSPLLVPAPSQALWDTALSSTQDSSARAGHLVLQLVIQKNKKKLCAYSPPFPMSLYPPDKQTLKFCLAQGGAPATCCCFWRGHNKGKGNSTWRTSPAPAH